MKRLLVCTAILAMSAPVFAQNAAIVNGKAIPSQRVDQFVEILSAQGQAVTPELRAQIREELINREIFLQEAEKRGVAKKPEVQAEIDLNRQSVLIRALFSDYIEKNPITDAAVQAEYDRVKAEQSGDEYLARHILVETEEEANKILASLKNGTAFEELAKQSKDPGSAANGGSLGWSPAATYVEPFAKALESLKKGETTPAPVKSDFGYHVIYLEDVRPQSFPELEQVRDQVEEGLRQQQLHDFQASLRANAKIQ